MSRRVLSGRFSISLLIILLLSVPMVQPKDKKKQLLPEDVLRAQTIMVVIHPDAGEAVTAPLANRNAQDEVERAITKWGRFDLVMDAYTADLIIAVRKGNKSGPIIAHSPADNRPVIFQPGIQTLASASKRTVLQTCLSLLLVIWGIGARSSGLRSFRPTILLKCIGAGSSIRWIRRRSGAISRRTR